MLNKFCLGCEERVGRLGTKRCRKCYGPYLSKLVKGKRKSLEHIKKLSGENHYKWMGGRALSTGGYVLIKDSSHPKAIGGYVLEHRLVLEDKLGRFLKDEEVVHHIDGNKQNNKETNLMLFKNHSDHMKYEHKTRRVVK